MSTRHANVHPVFASILNAMTPAAETLPAAPHSTPIGAFPQWRVDELARKYASPDDWTPELDGDGEIDDVELEESGESEEWS